MEQKKQTLTQEDLSVLREQANKTLWNLENVYYEAHSTDIHFFKDVIDSCLRQMEVNIENSKETMLCAVRSVSRINGLLGNQNADAQTTYILLENLQQQKAQLEQQWKTVLTDYMMRLSRLKNEYEDKEGLVV